LKETFGLEGKEIEKQMTKMKHKKGSRKCQMKDSGRRKFTAIASMTSLQDVNGSSKTFQRNSFRQWNSGKHVEEVIENHQYRP
jgi:hypothetical protein